jgi:hypothetical protein
MNIQRYGAFADSHITSDYSAALAIPIMPNSHQVTIKLQTDWTLRIMTRVVKDGIAL